MKALRTLIAILLVAAGTAATGQPIEIEPEQAIVLHVDDAANVRVAERRQAEWTPFDVVTARQLASQVPPEEPLPYASP